MACYESKYFFKSNNYVQHRISRVSIKLCSTLYLALEFVIQIEQTAHGEPHNYTQKIENSCSICHKQFLTIDFIPNVKKETMPNLHRLCRLLCVFIQ